MNKHSVLIIEDDPVTAKIFATCLNEKYDTFSARCVFEAKELLEQNDIAVLIIDFVLPDGTALDILDYLEEINYEKPSIVCTKFDETQNMISAWKKGAFDFIQKPISKTLLLEHVKIATHFKPPYALKNSSYMQGINDLDLTPVIDFTTLSKELSNNKDLIETTLTSSIEDINKHLNHLNNLNLNEITYDEEILQSPFVFHLSYLKNSARSIFASLLEANCNSILESLHRGESIQESDILHLIKNAEKLKDRIKFTKERLSSFSSSFEDFEEELRKSS